MLTNQRRFRDSLQYYSNRRFASTPHATEIIRETGATKNFSGSHPTYS